MAETESSKKIHHGRNIKRFREMFGMKQEAFAIELGEDWSQKKVSRLEDTEVVAEDVLERVAKTFQVPVEAIKNFSEEAAINIISNTFSSHDSSASYNWIYPINHNPVFSANEQINSLLQKIESLYERLLATEREKVELLERFIERK